MAVFSPRRICNSEIRAAHLFALLGVAPGSEKPGAGTIQLVAFRQLMAHLGASGIHVTSWKAVMPMNEVPDPRFVDTSARHFSGSPQKRPNPTPTVPQWAAYVLLVAGLVAGVWLHHSFGHLLTDHEEEEATFKKTPSGITPTVLTGPGAKAFLPQPAIVHVWLEGCADCMGAFRAMKEGRDAFVESWPLPVINVAYGKSSMDFALEYKVDDQLVFDPSGAAMVRPLGIGTFTTLVFDAEGNLLHRDRPDRPGYQDRVFQAASQVRAGLK
jgi:hypothetical protein